MVSRTIVTCGIMAGIFAFSTLIASLLLAICISSRGFSVVMGIILFLFTALFIYLSFFKNEEGKLRLQYLFVAILSVISAFVLVLTPAEFHVKDSRVNKLSIYAIVAASFTLILSVLTTFITSKTIPDVLKSGNVDRAQETTLYIIINIVIAFLIAISFILNVLPENSMVFSKAFTLSIIVWVIAALIGVGVGYILESKSTPLASAYDSNYDTNNYYDSVK